LNPRPQQISPRQRYEKKKKIIPAKAFGATDNILAHTVIITAKVGTEHYKHDVA
jgi:hypothetical protein